MARDKSLFGVSFQQMGSSEKGCSARQALAAKFLSRHPKASIPGARGMNEIKDKRGRAWFCL